MAAEQVASTPAFDTLEYWREQVLGFESEISIMNLKLAKIRVNLTFAKRRYRQKVLAQRVCELGPITEDEQKHILATIWHHAEHANTRCME